MGYTTIVSQASKNGVPGNGAPKNGDSYQFELSGGALCLDFANTIGDRSRAESEHLNIYQDLLAWADQAEALEPRQIAELAGTAVKHPRKAASALRHAIDLREGLFRIFSTLAQDGQPAAEDVASLNSALQHALPHLEICEGDTCFTWTWDCREEALDGALWPVVRSAAELLTSDEANRVRECASDTCTWLFVDRSRTHRRKWCDMAICGNRAKARRHYQRRKQEQEAR